MRTLFGLTLSWILFLPLLFSEAQQAHVEPRTITLPVVDGKGIRFTRLSTDEGLSQTKITHIVQDDQGFMWFGTQYGLNRYDGYTFKLFVHDSRNPKSLSGVYVRALFKDRDGALWIGCDQFINKFNRATETFTRYPVPFVRHISQDSAGILWLATGKGLYRLDSATGTIRQYSHNPNDPSSLSNNDVNSSGEDKEGRFWVATTGHLDEFDRRTGKVTWDIPVSETPLGFGFYEDRFGVFWIFHSTPNALSVFDRKTSTLTNYSFHELEPSATALTAITGITEDRNGTLWLATHGAGLLKLDREHRRLVRYRNNPGDPDSLLQNNVENLFADREGSIWAGLGRMGVIHFATNPLPFKRIPHLVSSEGTAEPFVGAIYEDRQGIVWVGTPEALNSIDRKAGHYTSYRRAGGPAVGTDVIAIREDHSGNLWAGTYNHGLLRLDRRTGQFQTYYHNPADPYSLSNDIVTRLLVDHNGTFWVATNDGLNRFNSATGRFTVYKLDPQRRSGSYLELVEDREGALWLGTDSSGLQRFDPATGQFTRYEHDMDRSGTLSDNRVNSVYFDRSGTMWVGTQNGLDKFDSKTGTFTVYTRRDGLPGNAVGCILEDDHGALWMSTNSGVSRFDPQRTTFKRYSTADGLPGADLTGWGACFKSVAGEMFFAGFSGATAFFPDQVTDSVYVPPIVLTNFRLSGRPVEIGGSSPLEKSVSYANALTLSHRQNMFSLEFSALSYLNPVTNRYRYKLEGLDSDWHEVGSEQRLVNYTTLPAGIYSFRVQGATNRGPWSEPGVTLKIEVLPPWWSTLWFRTTCAALLVLLAFAAYSYRLHEITRQFALLLEERIGERTRIARELHDTLLQSFQGLLFRLQAVHDLLPRRPAEAIQLLDGVLDRGDQAIAEGRDAVQGLRSSTVIDSDLIQRLTVLAEELAATRENHTSPTFRLLVEGRPRLLDPILQDEIYRIAREALGNAFRHAHAQNIEAEITYGDRLFVLRIRDNGCGMDTSGHDRGSRAGHWGLIGMRERAKTFGGQVEVWSQEGAGTEVELTISSSIAYKLSPARFKFRSPRKKSEKREQQV
jgi:ligand-binding sensor domain-containing protein/signal transduction histidine kinase